MENQKISINGREYIFVPWAAYTAVERLAWVYKTCGSAISLGVPILRDLAAIDIASAGVDEIVQAQGATMDKLAELSSAIEPAQVRQVVEYLLDDVRCVLQGDGATPQAVRVTQEHFNAHPEDLFPVAIRSAIVQFSPFIPGGARGLLRRKAPESQSPKTSI